MARPFVCSNCRRELQRSLQNKHRLYEWSRKALGREIHTNEAAAPSHEDAATRDGGQEGSPQIRNIAIDRKRSRSKDIRPKRPPRNGWVLPKTRGNQRWKHETDNILESLFQSSANRVTERFAPSLPPENIGEESSSKEGIAPNPVTRLNEILHSPAANLSDAWKFYETHFARANDIHGQNSVLEDRLLPKRESAFFYLLHRTILDWSEGNASEDIPSPADAAVLLRGCDLMRDRYWATTFTTMIESIVKSGLEDRVVRKAEEGRPAQRGDSLALEDLLDVWREFFQVYANAGWDNAGKHDSSEASKALNERTSLVEGQLWPWLPSERELSKVIDFHVRNIRARFNELIPTWPREQGFLRTAKIEEAATITCDLLIRSIKELGIDQVNSRNARSFLFLMAHILKGCTPYNFAVETYLAQMGIREEAVKSIVSGWGQLVNDTMIYAQDMVELSAEFGQQNRSYDKDPDLGHNSYAVRIDRAMLSKDERALEAVWQKFVADTTPTERESLPKKGVNGDSEDQSPVSSMRVAESQADVYNKLLEAFMFLKLPHKAVDVWNHMVGTLGDATLSSWDALLVGCWESKDAKMGEQIWSRMRSAGVQPNDRMWRRRLKLLFSRSPRDGLEAINDIIRPWSQARESYIEKSQDVPGPARLAQSHALERPSTRVMNAAIKGLLKCNMHEDAHRVFSWMQSIGVAPNTVTYNAFIDDALAADRINEARDFISRMENANIQPDLSTFTAIISCLFRRGALSPSVASPEAQQAGVTSILSQMESCGFKANQVTYGVMINSLLRTPANPPAAKAVLEHMRSRNVRLSSYHCTTLLTHHFKQEPPNLNALDALWNHIHADGMPLDNVFYDRMIEGYARIMEIGKMMFFLRRAQSEGKNPGWIALQAIFDTLFAVGEDDVLEELVGDAVARKGIFMDDGRARKGERDFWTMVELLKGKGYGKRQEMSAGDGKAAYDMAA